MNFLLKAFGYTVLTTSCIYINKIDRFPVFSEQKIVNPTGQIYKMGRERNHLDRSKQKANSLRSTYTALPY